VAQWTFDHGQIAGRGTDTLPSAQALYLPLQSPNGTVGVLAVRHPDVEQLLLPEYRQILENYSTQVAMAVDRDRLTLESDKARIEAETERLRSTLLTSVSHDLRTPLAVIEGATDSLLHANTPMPEETRHELLESISKETNYLSRLVENLLRLTQLSSAGPLALNREWHPAEELIGSALRCVERTLGDRTVNVDLPSDMLWINADAVLVEQALVNLLENACRYTPAGAPIEITARSHGNKTVLEIADRGPGLPPGEEQRIFEKFQRGTAMKPDSRGAGLGLAICRAIMDAHGGRINARNREGGGAIFRLEFVADSPPPADVGPGDWSENGETHEARGSRE
jgi:two-component system sensor histidine kinase KdpD